MENSKRYFTNYNHIILVLFLIYMVLYSLYNLVCGYWLEIINGIRNWLLHDNLRCFHVVYGCSIKHIALKREK